MADSWLYLILVLAVTLGVPILAEVFKLGLGSAFRIHRPKVERAAEAELADRYRREMESLKAVETLLTMALLFASPIAFYFLAKFLYLRDHGGEPVFLYAGAVEIAIPQMIGGVMFGAFLMPIYIRMRFWPEDRDNLLLLYARSEDRYGHLGRFLTRFSWLLAALLISVPIYFRGQRYSIVTDEAIDTWKGGSSHERVVRPHTDVCRIVQVKKYETGEGSGPEIFVAYRDGTVFDTESAVFRETGHLASWGVKPAIEAAEKIAGVTGVEFEKLLLPEGEPDLGCKPEPGPPEPGPPEPAEPEPATPEPAESEPAESEPAESEPATPEPATPGNTPEAAPAAEVVDPAPA